MSDTGIVSIHGKQYKTVALRVNEFRVDHKDWGILTELVDANETTVIMKASITNGDTVVGTGYAEERRDSSMINKTSALENCETSAIGRALAACGYAGTEYASANEVENAIHQQKTTPDAAVYKRFVTHMIALMDNIETILSIKEHLQNGDMDQAAENWADINHIDVISALSLAPTKGGCFTIDERKKMGSDEFKALMLEHRKDNGVQGL